MGAKEQIELLKKALLAVSQCRFVEFAKWHGYEDTVHGGNTVRWFLDNLDQLAGPVETQTVNPRDPFVQFVRAYAYPVGEAFQRAKESLGCPGAEHWCDLARHLIQKMPLVPAPSTADKLEAVGKLAAEARVVITLGCGKNTRLNGELLDLLTIASHLDAAIATRTAERLTKLEADVASAREALLEAGRRLAEAKGGTP